MKNIITLILLINTSLIAQSGFELLLPISEDTTVTALSFQESEEGDYYILSNIQDYYEETGIPIEGTYTYGSGMTRLSNNGSLLWQNIYPTASLFSASSDLNLLGRVPTDKFSLANNGIFLPYSLYKGIVLCDENTGIFTFAKAILIIDKENGEVLEENNFPNDTDCRRDKIELIKQIGNDETALVYSEHSSNTITVDHINENLELNETNDLEDVPFISSFNSSGINFYFSDDFSDSTFIVITATSLSLFNFAGIELENFSYTMPIDLSAPKMFVTTNEDYYAILATAGSPAVQRNSVITIINRTGDLIAQKMVVL